MAQQRASPTTKDIGLLHKLYKDGELELSPEYQRDSVWPRQAKAYLLDTVLNEKPIPLIFMMRTRSAQTGKGVYLVIDGQQRLRAIFDFLGDKFRLTETKGPHARKKCSQLPPSVRDTILNYDLIVNELSGYSESDIRDIFVRMNKYVVKGIRNAAMRNTPVSFRTL